MPEARIDKWMWAVRIFKTRTIAAEACKKGRISINGSFVKASRMIKPGDVIQVKKAPHYILFQSITSYRETNRSKACIRDDGKRNDTRSIRTFGNEQNQWFH